MNENIIDLWSNNIFTLKDGIMIIKGPSNKNKEIINKYLSLDKKDEIFKIILNSNYGNYKNYSVSNYGRIKNNKKSSTNHEFKKCTC